MSRATACLAMVSLAGLARAAPESYTVDSRQTIQIEAFKD
jgi:hypothetical protein